MLLGALLDLGGDTGAIDNALAALGDDSLVLEHRHVDVDGERAVHVSSILARHSIHADSRDSDNEAHCSHAHRHLSDVLATVSRMGLGAEAEAVVRRVFLVLGRAEALAHGAASEWDVGLHEVAELDSILDVVGGVLAWQSLGSPALFCESLPSGQGTVSTSHGDLECPVPAVVNIAQEAAVPLRDAPELRGETITPTGIAMLVGLGCRFVSSDDLAAFAAGRLRGVGSGGVGVGAGTRRFPSVPNVVRLYGYS